MGTGKTYSQVKSWFLMAPFTAGSEKSNFVVLLSIHLRLFTHLGEVA
jgi:hypothetical protein